MKTNTQLNLVLMMVLPMIAISQVPSKTLKAVEAIQEIPYEIYPIPHSVSYDYGNSVEITDSVNVIFETGIDQATIRKTYDLLSSKDVLAYKVSAVDTSRTNILLGIYGSNQYVDNFANDNIVFESSLFAKIDAYLIQIKDHSITILGKDTDAVFYGLATLKMIFDQTNRSVFNLEIRDYSDCEYRGFIEGYYGLPWTTEERIDLMEYGSNFKSNIYIYAPKDDSYHSSNWRGLYSAPDLAELKEQIAAGARTKTRFAWSIHPFLSSPITASNFASGEQAVKDKFEQLYQAGVRQFVISADDVEVPDGTTVDGGLHKNLLNDMSQWCRSKGDCYDLIFVPSAYCYQSKVSLRVELAPYFAGLMDGLDESVRIMWTGNGVCSSVSTGKFSEFTELTGRKAFMWLNWPVNDYSPSHVLMGKAEILDEKLASGEEPNFLGIVTNPMQQAEPSKLSIFAIADYCWNINDFDVDKSYQKSFKYVEPTATSAFYELCQHLSNAGLYEGEYFAESESLVPYVEAFEAAVESDSGLTASSLALQTEIRKISVFADEYLNGASNIALKSSIKPWIDALKVIADSIDLYLDIIVHAETWDKAVLKEKFDAAEALFATLDDCKAPELNKLTFNIDYEKVSVAPVVLTPLVQEVVAIAKDAYCLSSGLSTGVTYRGFDGIYEGELENVTDGDDSTFVWFSSKPSTNGYLRVDLGEPTLINDIKILSGNDENRDFMYGFVEVSSDGKSYTVLGSCRGAETILDLRSNPVTARFIRIRNNGTETWVAFKEVSINQISGEHGWITYGNIELEASVPTSVSNMIDGDTTTFTWFGINRTPGAYLELDLGETKNVNHIALLMAKPTSQMDYFPGVTFSYSSDGMNYVTLGTYTDLTQIEIALATPISARYIRATSTTTSPYGVVIREFSASLV